MRHEPSSAMFRSHPTSGYLVVVIAWVVAAFRISSLATISSAQQPSGAVHCRGCEHAFQPTDGLFSITRPESLRASVVRRTELLRVGGIETRLYWLAQVSPVVDDDDSVALSSLETWLRSGRNPSTPLGSHGQGALAAQYFPGRPRGDRAAPVRVLFFKQSQESAVDATSTLPLYSLKQQPWLLDISWFRGFIPRPVFCPVCSSFLGWEFIPWGFSRYSGVTDRTDVSDYFDIVDLLGSTGAYSSDSYDFGKFGAGKGRSKTNNWDSFSTTRKPFFALFADELLFPFVSSESRSSSSVAGLSLLPLAQFLQPPEFESLRRIFRLEKRQASLREGLKESDPDQTLKDYYHPNGRALVHVTEPNLFLASVWVESPARLLVMRVSAAQATPDPQRPSVTSSLDVEIEVLRERINAMRHHLAQWRRIVRRLPILGDAMNLLVLEPASMLTDGLKVLVDDLGSARDENGGFPEAVSFNGGFPDAATSLEGVSAGATSNGGFSEAAKSNVRLPVVAVKQLDLGSEDGGGQRRSEASSMEGQAEHAEWVSSMEIHETSRSGFSYSYGGDTFEKTTLTAASDSVPEARSNWSVNGSDRASDRGKVSDNPEPAIDAFEPSDSRLTAVVGSSSDTLSQQQVGSHSAGRDAVPLSASVPNDHSIDNSAASSYSAATGGSSSESLSHDSLDAMVTVSLIGRVSWTLIQLVRVVCVAATEVTFYPVSRQFVLDVQHVRRNSNSWVGLLVAVATIAQFVLSWVLLWRLVIVPVTTKMRCWIADRVMSFLRWRNSKKRAQQADGSARYGLVDVLRDRNSSRRQPSSGLPSRTDDASAFSWSSIRDSTGSETRRRRVSTSGAGTPCERRSRRRWENRQLARSLA